MSNSILTAIPQFFIQREKRTFGKQELFVFFIALASVNISLIIWSYYETALPVYDMACHILSGFSCCDLLTHAHLRSLDWWHSLMSVSPLYPPFVYLVYGVFKAFLGPQHWVDILVHLTFASILFSSVYGLGKLIFKDQSIALLSSLLIFACPDVYSLAHYDMLDLPGLAMVALALFCFTWWQEKPFSLANIFLGITCALAALTKNNCVAFLIAPLLLSLGLSLYKRDWSQAKSLVLAGITSLLVMLPWLIFAARTMFEMVAMYQQKKYQHDLLSVMGYYIFGLPELVSGFLFSIFILAVLTCPKNLQKRMVFLFCSAVGGISILILFRWNEQVRYALPTAIPIVLYSAWSLKHFWSEPRTRFLSIACGLIVCFAFLENNFTPYPLTRTYLPVHLAKYFGIEPARTDNHHAPGGTSRYPTPPADWGYTWVLETIKPHLNFIKQEFCVLPDSEEESSTIYSYLVRCNNMNVHAFTPRNWTMNGDDVSFNPKTAMYVNWYLLKTGSMVSPASRFSGKASEDAYIHWCNFVRSSDRFKLMGSKPLPDGTQLELYRNLSI